MTLFDDKVPGIMRLLMRDFSLSEIEAAAICGNLGHESGGFEKMQEIRPTVRGSRGGYGWAQWTGPRRRQFEAYCARNKLARESDKANYGFLFTELKGGERGALAILKRANDNISDKTIAFERGFERAGVKHYPSRIKWAKRALKALGTHPPMPPDDPGIREPRVDGFWGAVLRILDNILKRMFRND